MTTLDAGSRQQTEPSTESFSRRGSYSLWIALLVLALLYTLSQFKGMEYHSGYWGNVYQAIHPDSFPGDRYMSFSRPTLLSGYYVIAKVVGDLWMDDRFTMAIYFALAIFALVVIDKTVCFCGLTGIPERVAILALMILEHRFRDNQADVVSHWDFNATMMAGPFALLLLYYSLSEAALLKWLLTAGVLIAISMKVAWVPVLIGLVILFKERLNSQQRLLGGGAAALLSLASLIYYYVVLRTPTSNHSALFDFVVQVMDNSEANPFLDTRLSNVLFFILSGAGLLIRLPNPALQRRLRMVSIIAVGLWFVGGCYLSYAPDVLKIPYLVPFDVNRGLFWPQYLLFIGLASWALASHSRFPGSWWGATFLLFALYLTNTGLKRQIVFGVTALTVLVGFAVISRIRDGEWTLTKDPAAWTRGMAASFFITTVLYLGTTTIQRLPDLKFLAEHGILGDNPGAKWVGVNEYIRAHTPPSAVVFALATREYPWRAEGLIFAGSLRCRTGRSMQLGHDVADHFNYDFLMWNRRRTATVQNVVDSWNVEAYSGVVRGFQEIGFPDYLVVPKSKSEWLAHHLQFPYRPEAFVREYVILKKYS